MWKDGSGSGRDGGKESRKNKGLAVQRGTRQVQGLQSRYEGGVRREAGREEVQRAQGPAHAGL